MADKKRFPNQPDDTPATEPKEIDLRTPLERELAERSPELEAEIEERARLQEELDAIRHHVDPEYKAKNRAEFLGSMQIDAGFSPANRLKINRSTNDPMGYRWNHDSVRDRFGMEDWKPVTDMDKARRLCPSSHLRVGEDGRIYSGDSYLCEKPQAEVEKRNAYHYQRTLSNQDAINKGGHGAARGGGVEDFSAMHERTKSKSDPIGIRFNAKFEDDSSSE